MNDRIGLQMTRVTQDANKDIFGSDLKNNVSSGSLCREGNTHMQVDRGAHDQSYQCNTVRHHLDGLSCAL
jgi:hypothetical protein